MDDKNKLLATLLKALINYQKEYEKGNAKDTYIKVSRNRLFKALKDFEAELGR
jgi:hypothetical protein